jgi:hypothetical protein
VLKRLLSCIFALSFSTGCLPLQNSLQSLQQPSLQNPANPDDSTPTTDPAPAEDPLPPPNPLLKFTTQPAGTGLSVGWSQQPVVTIYDANGNVSNSSANVQIQIVGGPTGAVLSGLNINQQAVAGVATFSDLSINKPGVYHLIATVDGSGSAASDAFEVKDGTGVTYYVSPSGDDNNNGLSAASAWQTVAKVNAFTFAAGDKVLFEGGQQFSGCLRVGSNVQSTASQPFTIGSYGTGKFQLNANCTKSESSYDITHNKPAVEIGAITGFVLQDCILRGNETALAAVNPQPVPAVYGAPYGVLFDNGYYGSGLTTASVTIQRCDISGFFTPYAQDFGGDIFFNTSGPTRQISILNNEIHGGAGVYSPDDNGIGVAGNAVASRLTDMVVQGNHVYNIGARPGAPGGTVGSGIMVGGKRILIQNNVAHDTGGNTNTCGGPSNIWAVSADRVVIQYNEAYGSAPKDPTIASGGPNAGGCDWDGFDLDMRVTNSVVQYNYSHDNWGAGYLAFLTGTWGPNTYRFNISVNDGKKGFGSFTIADWSNSAGTVYVYNNFFDSVPVGGYAFYSGGHAVAGVFANNVFRPGVTSGQALFANTNGSVHTSLQFINNAYWSVLSALSASFFNWNGAYRGVTAWQTGRGQDPLALAFSAPTTPGITLPASTITCPVAAITGAFDASGLASCLGSAYQSQTGDPTFGTGIDLRAAPYSVDMGTRDLFGNLLDFSKLNVGVD